jgi:hypothetical protein
MRCITHLIHQFLHLPKQIEEVFPETARFTGQWGVDRITKQCWDNRKNCSSYVNNLATYRRLKAVARCDACAAAASPASCSRSCSGSCSLSAGPSQPRRVPHVDNSEEENESSHDTLAPFSGSKDNGNGLMSPDFL